MEHLHPIPCSTWGFTARGAGPGCLAGQNGGAANGLLSFSAAPQTPIFQQWSRHSAFPPGLMISRPPSANSGLM